MTKTKESVERVEDLKAQVGEILGVTDRLDDDLIKSMEEAFIEGQRRLERKEQKKPLLLLRKP